MLPDLVSVRVYEVGCACVRVLASTAQAPAASVRKLFNCPRAAAAALWLYAINLTPARELFKGTAAWTRRGSV